MAVLLGALWLSGCVADGTDFEALPFVRIDRTEPEVTLVDVPLLLLSVDTYPAKETPPDSDVEEAEADADEGAEQEEDRDYRVRFPYPLGVFIKRGKHTNWFLAPSLFSDGSTNSGPAGRGLSSEDGVSRDALANFASDPEPGGLSAIPLIFSATWTDHNDIPDTDGEDMDSDIHLWPFLAMGYGDKDEDDYFAVAPLGGVTKGVLGKKRITWFGFPYPVYANVEDRAYESHHVLFPFINWVDGPQNEGFRVLPFYAHYERKGVRGDPIYEKTWIMWPFFTWSRSGLNEAVPTETLFLFPFYGRTWSKDYASLSIMWPFFKYEERTDEKGRMSWELRAPFPFFQIAEGPEHWKFDLWPFFGVKARKGYSRTFFMWPMGRLESMETSDKTFSGQWLLPLYWRTRWDYLESGQSEERVRVFPFVHYRKLKDTSVDVSAISPWVFDDPGFERIFHPFFRFYRYHRDADGGTEHQALLGLFSYRDLPAVPEREKSAYTRLSLLFGL